MAAPPTISRLPLDGVSTEVPQWFQDLLTPLNQFIGATTNALSGQLTLGDNVRAGVRASLAFRTSADALTNGFKLSLANPLPVRPTALLIEVDVKSGDPLTGVWSHTFRLNQNNSISLTFQGLPNSTDMLATVVFI